MKGSFKKKVLAGIAAMACAVAVFGFVAVAKNEIPNSIIGKAEEFAATAPITTPDSEVDEVIHISGSTAAELRAAWDAAVNASSEDHVVKIVLDSDWIISESSRDTAPYIKNSSTHRSIVLDLNGHTIKRTSGSYEVMQVNNTDLTIEDSSAGQTGTITGGNTSSGAGVSFGGGNLTINGGNFTGNTGSKGAISVSGAGSSFTMNGGNICNNVAWNPTAGVTALFIDSNVDGNITINGGDFSHNGEGAGAIRIEGSGSCTIQNVTITDNGGYGIALANKNATLSIQNSTISDNGTNGVRIIKGHDVTIQNCVVSKNGDTGIYQNNTECGTMRLKDTIITSNKNKGVDVRTGELIIDSCAITGNTVSDTSSVATAGVAYNSNVSVTISGKTQITGNTTGDGRKSDLAYQANSPIQAGALDAESSIGVNIDSAKAGAQLVEGFAENNPGKNLTDIFYSNNSKYEITDKGIVVQPTTINRPTASDATFVYTGSQQTYTPKNFNSTYMQIANNEHTDAGTYTVTVTPQNGGVWSGDYSKDPVTFTFVIAKATPTITPSQASVTVKEGIPYTVTGTASNGATVTVEYFDSTDTSFSNPLAAAPTAEGSYTVKLSLAETSNYKAAEKTVSLTIQPHDHTWGSYTYNNDATCTADGTETASCTFGGGSCSETNKRTKAGTKIPHSWGSYTSNGDADCINDGTETATCSGCGKKDTRTETGSALGHSMGSYVPDADTATCTKDGTKTAICSRCGHQDTVENTGSALGHNYVYTSDGNATCDNDGTKTGVCSRCGGLDSKTDAGTATGHKYGYQYDDSMHWQECSNCGKKQTYAAHAYDTFVRTNKLATEAEEGEEVWVCACAREYIKTTPKLTHTHNPDYSAWQTDGANHWYACTGCSVQLDKAPHSFGNWIVTATATCENDGSKFRACDDCGYKETQSIDKLNHIFGSYVPDGNAECLTDGTKTATCTRCSATDTVEDTGSALGHDMSSYAPDGNAGCLTDGTKTSTCSRCSETDTVEDTGSALGHDYVYTSDGNATCENDGTKTGKCSRCGGLDSQVDTGTATGHSFDYDYDDDMHWQVCANCSNKKDYGAHDFSIAGATTKLPTETEEGEQTYLCVCGADTTKMIPVLGHTHVKGEQKFDNNSHWYACTGCSLELDKENHSFGGWTVSLEADCENDGSKWSVCSGCGNKITLTIPALGHDFGEWTESVAATCTEDGEEKRTCNTCGSEETRPIDALEHEYEGNPTWNWSNNYHSATATFSCKRGDSGDLTVAATVTENKEDATCTKPGLLSFLATVTLNGETYTDEKKDVVTTLPHDYVVVVWDWADDYSSASVTVECSVCGHLETAKATIKKDRVNNTLVATATIEGVKFTDTVDAPVAPTPSKTVIDGTWNLNGEVPKFESDNSSKVFVTYYDENGNVVTELKKGSTYSVVISLKDSANYEFASDLETEKIFTSKVTTTIDPVNYRPSDGTGDNPSDREIISYLPVILSGISIILIIVFAVMSYNSAAVAKSAKEKTKRIAATSYSFAPVGLLALVLGISQASWWVIAGILMGCALITGIVALLFNGKKRRALEALEEEQENVRANERVRRDDEMRMMFAAMQQNSQQPQMNFGDMRSVIQETVSALLPGLQQLQALPPASDNADGAQGDIDGLQAKMAEQQELLTQILENQQNYVIPLYEDELQDDLTWLGESEEVVTLEESYGALSDEGKTAYYEIGSYIMNKPRTSQNDGKYAVLFKYRGKTVFKLAIKDDAPVLYYPSDDGGKSEIRLEDTSALESAKSIVDSVIMRFDN